MAVSTAYRSVVLALAARDRLDEDVTTRELVDACRETFAEDDHLDALERLAVAYERVCYADDPALDQGEVEGVLDRLVDPTRDGRGEE